MSLHPEYLSGSLIATSEKHGGKPLKLGRLAVLGPGLLGGSVALAARELGLAETVALWARRDTAVEELLAADAADVVSSSLGETVSGADLVVIATPVGAVESLLVQILPFLDGAVVTDLCSVKAAVETAVAAAFSHPSPGGVSFVGAHPMAGSDRTGFSNASASLFQGASCALTPGEHSTDTAIDLVDRFWSALGCRTITMDAAAHDQMVARISHLPHLAASALVNAALRDHPAAGDLAGPGFKDSTQFAPGGGFRDNTRIASASPEMWAEIVAENRQEVVAALEAYVGEIGEVLAKLKDLDNGGVCRFLADAKRRRDTLFPPPGGTK